MASFYDARDHDSGQFLGSLPCSAVAFATDAVSGSGLAHRLRVCFVDKGLLSPEEAEQADFEIREGVAAEAQP